MTLQFFYIVYFGKYFQNSHEFISNIYLVFLKNIGHSCGNTRYVSMLSAGWTAIGTSCPTGGAKGTDRDAGALGGLSEAVQYELLNRSTTSLRTLAISSAVQPLCLNHSSFLSGLIT